MRIRALQFFFLAFLVSLGPTRADLSTSQTGSFKFNDVDGHTLSIGDGRVTVVVIATKANLAKAELVGDRVPDFCLGNPAYRMITIVKFGKHAAPVQAFLASMARRRLDAEARKLQKRYLANKIDKNARDDVFVVADFEGNVSSQLGNESSDFRVLVFGRNGERLKQWDDVPSAEELAAALK